MQPLSEYLDEKNHENIINKIIELKTGPQSQEVKLEIQKLQQKLSKS